MPNRACHSTLCAYGFDDNTCVLSRTQRHLIDWNWNNSGTHQCSFCARCASIWIALVEASSVNARFGLGKRRPISKMSKRGPISKMDKRGPISKVFYFLFLVDLFMWPSFYPRGPVTQQTFGRGSASVWSCIWANLWSFESPVCVPVVTQILFAWLN